MIDPTTLHMDGEMTEGTVNLAKRQQDFEFAERRARFVFEMARDLGRDKDGEWLVSAELMRLVIGDFLGVEMTPGEAGEA